MPAHRSSVMTKQLPVNVSTLAMALALLALASCGPAPQAGGGIGGTGSTASVSSGPVTGLNSVYVSGTEYDNSNAFYCIDSEPCSTQNNLKLGMVVLLKGTAQLPLQGPIVRVADTITFEETVEGVVQSVSPDGSSLIVLGQFVDVNQKTVIDESILGRSIRNLKPGLDVIEVSGLVAGDGHILATLIMNRSGTPHYEVQGVIKNHDTGSKRFEIGQLVVEYSAADVSDITVDGTMNWNGRLIHARGDEWEPRSEVPYGATLTATRVKRIGLAVEDSADAKIEGFITHVTRPGAFAINNHPIEVSSATTFEGGAANELVLGAHVFIHGALVKGVLEAQQVIFKENLEIESNVESIDLQSRTLTLAGFRGLSIATDGRTVIRDGHTLSRFEDIRISDHLKVHARMLGQQVLAAGLERANPSTAIVLQAPLQSAVDPHVVLAGMTIDTSGLPEIGFLGAYGPIGRKTFFEKALIGLPVWTKGTLTGRIVTWSSVGISG